MCFRVRLFLVACALSVASSQAAADDVGAAARGVVRIIVAVQDYANPEDSGVAFGSGFAISPHRIVTNAHVVEAARNPFVDSIVAVVPAEGSKALRGNIVAYDAARDLAVVDVGDARLEPLAIYSGPVDSGEHTAALGYPGNVDLATARSMYDLITPTFPVRSEGNISSERTVDGTSALLHTAAISRGNSGGPLVDECGRILGVNTYTTRSGSGDAPFGFAIVSRELISFLREQSQTFRQVGSACVTPVEQAQREKEARETALRREAAERERTAQDQRRNIDAAEEQAKDSRQNHVAAAALLVILAIIAAWLAAALFFKDRTRAAAAAAGVAVVGLIAGAYAFFSRPSLAVTLPTPTASLAGGAAPLTGSLLCEVKPELSRVTISSTDDLTMSWEPNGCMNGRTQYVRDGVAWRRVLVPNGSATVSVQDFDPVKGEYISTRYLLPQTDIDRLRRIRAGNLSTNCSADPDTARRLRELTDRLVSSLPPTPNEKLVYKCVNSFSNSE